MTEQDADRARRTWIAVVLLAVAAVLVTVVVQPWASQERASPHLPPHSTTVPKGAGTLYEIAGTSEVVRSVSPRAAWLGAHSLVVGLGGGSGDCPNVARTARAVTRHQLAVTSQVVEPGTHVCNTDLTPEYTVLPVPSGIDRNTPVEITIVGTNDTIELPAYPSRLPSTCDDDGITAQVLGHASVGLLTCAGLAGTTPAPAFTIAIGQTVIIGENGINFTTLVAHQTTHVVSLDGTTITARKVYSGNPGCSVLLGRTCG